MAARPPQQKKRPVGHSLIEDINLAEIGRRRRLRERAREGDNHAYFASVAEARFVLRKTFRIIEDQAKIFGLDPLLHQALLQIYGSSESRLSIGKLADRLDISPQFTSSLIKQLTAKGLVSRHRDPSDNRVSYVAITGKATALLQQIDEQWRFHLDYFSAQLSDEQRKSAISIFMFYVGYR